MITASELPRLFACPGSGMLPRESVATKWTDAGDNRHLSLSRMLAFGQLPNGLPQDLVPLMPLTEQALAYDVASDRGYVLHVDERDYAAAQPGPFWICGTADVVGVLDADTVVVIDWKGWASVERASENKQALLYGLAYARFVAASRVLVVIAYVNDDMDVRRIDKHMHDAESLGAYAASLRDLFAGNTKLVPGEHCRYCDKFAACEAVQANALQRFESEASLAPAETMWHTMNAAKRYAKRAEEVLRARIVQDGPIVVDGGELRLVQSEGKRTVKDANAVYDVACKHASVESLAGAFGKHTTLGALKKAMGKNYDAALSEMEACGAVALSAGESKLAVVPGKKG
ncbi:MAG: DUF2800 domain-containing protein [Desulfurellales bacterium]|nr:MAG: DUF2800 domain-containing protein [Desulfurellales bacterium]